MPTDLYFDLRAALRLAEHAHTAPTHIQSLTETDDNGACPGGLEWVADSGTYLMSTGRPALLSDPDDATSNVVAYAAGFGPDSDRGALAATDVGGDDFAEHLHLHDGDPPLLALLRAGTAAGHRWLVLTGTADTVSYRLSRTGPPDTR